MSSLNLQPSTINFPLAPLVPLVLALCPCLASGSGPHFLTSSTLHFLPLVPRPCPTTSLPLQPRATPRFTLCDIRTIFSADLHMHMRNEVFTSLPAPPLQAVPGLGCRTPNHSEQSLSQLGPKPRISKLKLKPHVNLTEIVTSCATGFVTISHKGHPYQFSPIGDFSRSLHPWYRFGSDVV